MSDSSRPAALSAAALIRNSTGTVKSPTKSPARAPASALLRSSVDDVSYRQADSSRTTDQAHAADGSPAAATQYHGDACPGSSSADKQSKYINLLSAVYSHPPGAKQRSPAAAAASGQRLYAAAAPGSRQHAPSGVAPPADHEAPPPPPLRTSASPKGLTGGLSSSSTTPCLRRSVRASILDSSQGASLIPASPEAAAASFSSSISTRPVLPGAGKSSIKVIGGVPRAISPVNRLRSSAGSTCGPGRIVLATECSSPVRRSAPSAQPRPQYAFGTRIEVPAAIKRRPSPTRTGAAAAAGSGGSPIRAAEAERVGRLRAVASPQRVPSAARVSAPAATNSAGCRSASAPRMASADKLQSRFTQHALSAAAAQRSQTPNPAQRAAAAAAAAAASSGGSGINAARRLRQPMHAVASESKHVMRMRASESAVPAGAQQTRLPGFSSTSRSIRSPTKAPAGHLSSPMLRGGSSSECAAASTAAARPGSASKGLPAAAGSRVKPAARSTDRLAMSLPGAGSNAAAASRDCAAMVPVIKDRYKDLFKHTPAAVAVQDARAAAAARLRSPSPVSEHRRPRSCTVPKLALGSLSRQGSGEPLAAPRGPSQQQQHNAQDDARSPYLGRISGMAANPAAEGSSSDLHQAPGSFSTPQGQRKAVVPLLALSTITPVGRSRPAAAAGAGEASPFTPLQAAGGYLQHSAAGVEAVLFPGIELTPCPSAGPVQDETPSLLVKSQPCTGGSPKGAAGRQDAELEPPSPQLAPRDLSSGMQAAGSSNTTAVPEQQQNSSCSRSAQGGNAAAAGRGFAIPGLHLPGAAGGSADGHFDSPPKHRRGDRESPSSSADTGSQNTLKIKASTLCSTVSSSSIHAAPSALPERIPAASSGVPGRSGPPSASKPAAAGAKARQRVGGAAAGGSVLEGAEAARGKVGGLPIRRSLTSGLPSPPTSTPASRQQLRLEGTPGSQRGKGTPLSSPSKKLGTPVPRLDLTPVLASMAAEQDSTPDTGPESHSHQSMLLLEDAPCRRLDMHGDADEAQQQPHSGKHSGQRQSSGKGKPGSAKGRAGSGKSHGLSSNQKGPGSKGSQASAEPPPQESFYVYESVMPPEEQRTFEELRKVLMKAPGGSKHAANLQGIWGCYQDARRNTEAMAFRGHRLLDQVSTEYSSFKRDAEVKLEGLQHERDQAREELQLAMVAGSVPATALQLAAKDREVQELQEQNAQLRQQVAEYEKAMHMASEYHTATQAAHQEQQVPVHARVIAGSATTSILTNQVVQQQLELQTVEKRMEDMKAALHLACGVLRQTNYMDNHSELRSQLDPDTLTVLDTIMATEEMEAVAMQQEQQAHMLQHVAYEAAAAELAVHIEEVHDSGASTSPEAAALSERSQHEKHG